MFTHPKRRFFFLPGGQWGIVRFLLLFTTTAAAIAAAVTMMDGKPKWLCSMYVCYVVLHDITIQSNVSFLEVDDRIASIDKKNDKKFFTTTL